MEKFQLTPFLDVNGIGSASGLVHYQDSLFIISDNSGFLYEYRLGAQDTLQHTLVSGPAQNIEKKRKPDLESITLKDNKLYIFGSGATENRNRHFIFDPRTQEVSEKSLENLYRKVKTMAGISDDDLNIEGALFYKDSLYLFQRGNGANSQNGIVAIDHYNEEEGCNDGMPIRFVPVSLPKIGHVEATFTDAVLVAGKIYFLAAAEDSVSTYEDGEVLGSLVGCMDAVSFEVDFTIQITNTIKFEGLTPFGQSETGIIFLLCEDNDTEALESRIYKLEIPKPAPGRD
ncbi:DUF6929 family protein [Flavobacterium humi]|uniref:BPP domain-containing protein n=1 Tax=Flavobacterium humi TaxID=2562683 RepID=A0A4Z0L9G3_9FLAO|nr:hypothetical protein [Flavobacterium humi]TGD59105.1 hypothetical protein E4635_04440 [Flavobacterium humi]